MSWFKREQKWAQPFSVKTSDDGLFFYVGAATLPYAFVDYGDFQEALERAKSDEHKGGPMIGQNTGHNPEPMTLEIALSKFDPITATGREAYDVLLELVKRVKRVRWAYDSMVHNELLVGGSCTIAALVSFVDGHTATPNPTRRQRLEELRDDAGKLMEQFKSSRVFMEDLSRFQTKLDALIAEED